MTIFISGNVNMFIPLYSFASMAGWAEGRLGQAKIQKQEERDSQLTGAPPTKGLPTGEGSALCPQSP